MVDQAGHTSVLTFRYHVGRHLAGCSVEVENSAGLLHISHNGVLVATHAKRHLDDDDVKFEGRPKAIRPARPTTGSEVLRIVDNSGSVSFAGTGYRVGNKFKGQDAGVRLVSDTVQITIGGQLVRTHRARHDKSKEFGALAQPTGKARSRRDGVASLPEPKWDTGAELRQAIPLIPQQVAYFVITGADRYVVQHDLGAAPTGRYQVTYNVGAAAIILLTALNQAWLPGVFAIRDTAIRQRMIADSRDGLYRPLALVSIGLAPRWSYRPFVCGRPPAFIRTVSRW